MSPRLLRLRRLWFFGQSAKKNLWKPLVWDFLTAGYPILSSNQQCEELKEWTETLLLIICANCRAGCQSSSVSCQTSEPCYQPQQHNAIWLQKQNDGDDNRNSNAVPATTIRLRFDGRSTAYQRSLRSQWRSTSVVADRLTTVTLAYEFI